MTEKVGTIIIGGGQAGLSTSYHLKREGLEHLLLEQAGEAGHVWRTGRWDSFTLVTPNWSFRLPGAEYQGADPHGFMERDEVSARIQQYVTDNQLPIRCDVQATAVEQHLTGRGFRVHTNHARFEADNVVIATGLFQHPRRPACANSLPPHISQVHSSEYRNPGALPPGAVLVVGSSQSGCQIADELRQSGRSVYLCVGGAGRAPRRYRGKDSSEWQVLLGIADRTVDTLPSPKAKFAANPHVTGKNGGHNLNLHQFARDGIALLGRLMDVQDGQIRLAPDLKENLAKADMFEAAFLKGVDNYIAKNGIDVPPESLPQLQDGFAADVIEQLDLKATGIGTVIWAIGYTFDFSMVRLPILDGDGYPVQKRGVTDFPGLYFVGLPWLHKMKSGLLGGVGDDAAYIASHIAEKYGATDGGGDLVAARAG